MSQNVFRTQDSTHDPSTPLQPDSRNGNKADIKLDEAATARQRGAGRGVLPPARLGPRKKYSVTPALIEKVQRGDWDPANHEADKKDRDALAARGYFQAFQSVKSSIEKIFAGENPGALVRVAHKNWYRELFQPSVAAGLLPAGALAGYRNDAVYLRTSRYVPPRWEAVRDAMPELFDLLEKENDAGVRAVLGHWLFGYIHPYPDGNGRMARLFMNAMLASGGYPWTVVRVEDRKAYLAALDSASIDMDIRPFAAFIAERVQWSIKQEAAKLRA